jgi:hypothetical protein
MLASANSGEDKLANEQQHISCHGRSGHRCPPRVDAYTEIRGLRRARRQSMSDGALWSFNGPVSKNKNTASLTHRQIGSGPKMSPATPTALPGSSKADPVNMPVVPGIFEAGRYLISCCLMNGSGSVPW